MQKPLIYHPQNYTSGRYQNNIYPSPKPQTPVNQQYLNNYRIPNPSQYRPISSRNLQISPQPQAPRQIPLQPQTFRESRLFQQNPNNSFNNSPHKSIERQPNIQYSKYTDMLISIILLQNLSYMKYSKSNATSPMEKYSIKNIVKPYFQSKNYNEKSRIFQKNEERLKNTYYFGNSINKLNQSLVKNRSMSQNKENSKNEQVVENKSCIILKNSPKKEVIGKISPKRSSALNDSPFFVNNEKKTQQSILTASFGEIEKSRISNFSFQGQSREGDDILKQTKDITYNKYQSKPQQSKQTNLKGLLGNIMNTSKPLDPPSKRQNRMKYLDLSYDKENNQNLQNQRL